MTDWLPPKVKLNPISDIDGAVEECQADFQIAVEESIIETISNIIDWARPEW